MKQLLSFFSHHLEPLSLLKKSVKFIFCLAFAAVIFGLFLIFTPHGNQLALEIISQWTPYQVQCASISGNLYHDFVVEDVQIKGPQLSIKAKRIAASWDLVKWLHNDNTIQTLSINDLSFWYENKAQALILPEHYDNATLEKAQGDIAKSLPFAVNVENLEIVNADIHWNDIEHKLSELRITHATSNIAQIEEIHYKGAFGSLDANLKGAIKVDWNLDLSKNPFLVELNSSAITTQGSITLPSRNIDDPENQIQISVYAKEYTQGKHHLQNLQLDAKGTLVRHQVTLHGIYNKSPIESVVTGKFTDKRWQGNITKLLVNHERWQKIGNSTGKFDIQWQNKIVSLAEINLGEKYPITLEAVVDKNKPYALSGIAKANIKQLKTLSSLVPSLANMRGQLDIDLTLSGTILQPTWLGQILLTNAKLPATSLGKKAVLNDLLLSFLPNNQINIQGKGLWGSGEFTIAGKGTLFGPSPVLEVAIKGDKLLLSDTPEYYIVANPDLLLTLKKGQLALNGKIIIPEAEINSLKNPEMISASEDVVLVSKKAKPVAKPLTEQATHYQIATHIEVIIKDKITYKGHGITSKVGGRLEINQQPGQPPLAKGKLFLTNGSYKAYGKVFDINYGQILFTGGPIYDPILDIRAERHIQPQSPLTSFKSNQTILAGITFTGNLKTPKIGFYSNPSMPDPDIISYLIVGRPQNQINEAQAELLFQAVSQLATIMGGNRNDVHFDLAEKLKLDQLGFSKKQNYIPTPGSHNPLEDTVFVLGKQLSSRLYLNYSVGLVDSASQFGMRYAVGKNMMIEAATGTQGSSADVLLSFEGH
ncbi:MAG: translocation/assembly module TamB domain-containing protein [Proteobacteria bacterium]|nr:translocation/assembly module TamB domain-containing protein [Pseudomonadota bacterium]